MAGVRWRRLAAVIACAAAIAAPALAKGPAGGEKNPPPGRWHGVRPRVSAAAGLAGLTDEQRRMIERLEAMGYLAGSAAGGPVAGVSIHERERSSPGFNFYTSGHGPEAILMDMDGHELHRWRYPVADIWSVKKLRPVMRRQGDFWRRAVLLENGDVIGLFSGRGIFKIDKDSKLLWAKPMEVHHDLAVAPNGDIVTLTRTAHMVPRVHATEPIFEDFVVVLDPEGEVKQTVSILECFESSKYGAIWPGAGRESGDLFHTNTVEILDGRFSDTLPAFAKGNILTSMRALDTIAVLDLKQRQVVWAHKGSFHMQHDPKLLDGGHLLLFDNRGKPFQSAILELDPASGRTLWEYRGTPEHPFFSKTCGAVERLPNGNTLVTESDQGRAFEVTPDKEIVWEFHNPHRAGENGEFIATLFELTRLPPTFPIGWARRESPKP